MQSEDSSDPLWCGSVLRRLTCRRFNSFANFSAKFRTTTFNYDFPPSTHAELQEASFHWSSGNTVTDVETVKLQPPPTFNKKSVTQGREGSSTYGARCDLWAVTFDLSMDGDSSTLLRGLHNIRANFCRDRRTIPSSWIT